MGQLLLQGLLITIIGMGLVFAALAFLWGVMALMGRPELLSASEQADETSTVAEPPSSDLPDDEELAAIATALALLQSEQEGKPQESWQPQPALDRWLAIGHGRQLQSWHPRRQRGNG